MATNTTAQAAKATRFGRRWCRDDVPGPVDHIWPRGLGKAKAARNEWCKDVSPSTELRRWYGHDPAKFEEFTRRYCAELDDPERVEALQHLMEVDTGHRLTLLTATKNPDIGQAAVLCDLLRR